MVGGAPIYERIGALAIFVPRTATTAYRRVEESFTASFRGHYLVLP